MEEPWRRFIRQRHQHHRLAFKHEPVRKFGDGRHAAIDFEPPHKYRDAQAGSSWQAAACTRVSPAVEQAPRDHSAVKTRSCRLQSSVNRARVLRCEDEEESKTPFAGGRSPRPCATRRESSATGVRQRRTGRAPCDPGWQDSVASAAVPKLEPGADSSAGFATERRHIQPHIVDPTFRGRSVGSSCNVRAISRSLPRRGGKRTCRRLRPPATPPQ